MQEDPCYGNKTIYILGKPIVGNNSINIWYYHVPFIMYKFKYPIMVMLIYFEALSKF